jgi:phospholipid/cholesterol/gamma-HCH transport system substrate-binding protein
LAAVSGKLTRWQALLLGGAVLLGLGVAAGGLFSIGNRQWLWSDTFHLSAGFRQIQGVEIGTRVRLLGKEAGEVVGIDLPGEPSGEIVLQFKLDGRMRHLVRADARAQIVAEGMVGGKVVEIDPGSDGAEAVQDGARIASRPSAELTALLAQVQATLQGIGKGEGALGKLFKDDELYVEMLKLLRQGRGTMASLKQDADALKGMPLVRNYVQDPHKELLRPECERYRQWFPESDLFEPGHAVLTGPGRKRLDDLIPWLEGLKHKGSEVVVAAFADTAADADVARTLTQKQSEAVCDYLVGQHAVQKMGVFARRKVTPLGCGTEPSPLAEKEPLPAPRLEVLVFVPQG